MRYVNICLSMILCLSAVSCAPEQENVSAQAPVQEIQNQQADHTPEQGKILVSKGVIKSGREIAVYSRMTGQLKEVHLPAGGAVKKGDVIFNLEDDELKAAVELCEAELEQAQLNMESILIGQGYKRDELSDVPENIKRLAKIKSGCNVKEKQLEIARKKLGNTKIKAPTEGTVSGVTHGSYAYVQAGAILCKIIDTKHLVVVFSILETELTRFYVGKEIKILPISFINEECTATISSIGSSVNEAGMISVSAELDYNDKLLPGMTAIIKI